MPLRRQVCNLHFRQPQCPSHSVPSSSSCYPSLSRPAQKGRLSPRPSEPLRVMRWWPWPGATVGLSCTEALLLRPVHPFCPELPSLRSPGLLLAFADLASRPPPAFPCPDVLSCPNPSGGLVILNLLYSTWLLCHTTLALCLRQQQSQCPHPFLPIY